MQHKKKQSKYVDRTQRQYETALTSAVQNINTTILDKRMTARADPRLWSYAYFYSRRVPTSFVLLLLLLNVKINVALSKTLQGHGTQLRYS